MSEQRDTPSTDDQTEETHGLVVTVFAVAWPIALSYVAVGLPCGVLEAQTGMTPAMAFVMGATVLSGAGQFMMSNMWLAGTPVASIAASVATISTRFALYSASLAPHLEGASKRLGFACSATLTEEAYGISLGKLVEGGCVGGGGAGGSGWSAAHATLLNVMLLLTWAASCAAGAALGSVVDIPTAIAGFACTSLFICLLLTQPRTRGNAMAAAAAATTVAVCKMVGFSGMAVPLAALVGVAVALVAGDAV